MLYSDTQREVRRMADYKKMYLTMFHAAEDALNLLEGCCGEEETLQRAVNVLTAAQQRCEDIYAEGE